MDHATHTHIGPLDHVDEWARPAVDHVADGAPRPLRVYLAGPMSGIKDYNYPAFNCTASALRALSFDVENPAENPDPACKSWNGYLKTALRQMMTCDAVVLMPGWEKSRGANLEVDTARSVGIPVWPSIGMLLERHTTQPFEVVSAIVSRAMPGESDPEFVPGSPSITQPLFQPGSPTIASYPIHMRTVGAVPEHKTITPAHDGCKPTNPKDAIGSGKLPVHLWPETASIMGAMALLDGMLKYGRSNWREAGVRASIYVDALRRHVGAWFEGEDNDPDSGLPHLSHALACLAIIVDAQAAGTMTDDRQYPGAYRVLINALTRHVDRLKARHADKAPKHWTIADSHE